LADITNLRFAQLVKAALGLKAIDPAQHTTGTVASTFDIQDPYRPDMRLTRGERSFSAMLGQTNTVPSFAISRFVNPAGSIRILVISKVKWSGFVPTTTNQPGRLWAVVQLVSGFTPTAPTGNPHDGRIIQASGGGPAIVSGFTTGTTGVFGVASLSNATCIFAQEFVPGASNQPFSLEWSTDLTLSPNSGISISFVADTATVGAYNYTLGVEGFERIAEQAELASVFPP